MNLRKWMKTGAPVLFLGSSLLASSGTTPANVPSANPKVIGFAYPNLLSPGLVETPVAQGSWKLENPSGPCGTSGTTISYYGYDDNGPMVPALGLNFEANKTEPDKNTYLVLDRQDGADPHYDYGKHFLFSA